MVWWATVAGDTAGIPAAVRIELKEYHGETFSNVRVQKSSEKIFEFFCVYSFWKISKILV